jgi:molybdenum cofactor guanylyltransferase
MSLSLPSITIAILAGGAARRMGGRDKGLELLGERPLIAWMIEAVAQMDVGATARNLLIVANRHLDQYSRYATTISDDAPGFRGPLAGVASALAACSTSWLLTVPVDCPQPPCELASRLLHAARASRTDAVVAHDGERRQPLFAIYRRTLAASATAAAAAGQGVWQWQTSIDAQDLDFSDRRRQFRNLNTPEDFASHARSEDA